MIKRCSHSVPSQQIKFSAAVPWVSFVSLMFAFCYLSRAIFGPLLIYIEQDFSLSHSESTHLLMNIAAGYAASTFISAFTCSLIQPRRIVGLSIIACGILLLIIAETHSLKLFSFLFFLLGGAAGQYFNAGLSVLRSLVQMKDWGKAIAIHELGPTLSFIAAPLASALLVANGNWRSFLFGLGLACCITALLFLWQGKGGHELPMPVSLKGFYPVAKSARFWIAAWMFSMSVAGEFAPYSVLSLYLNDVFHQPPERSSTLLALSRIAPAAALLASGWMTEKLGAVQSLKLCYASYAASMVLLAAPFFWLATIGMFVQPVAAALSFPPLFSYIAGTFPLKEQPLLFALIIPLSTLIGSGISPRLLGICADSIGFSFGFLFLGAMVALCLAGLYAFGQKTLVQEY